MMMSNPPQQNGDSSARRRASNAVHDPLGLCAVITTDHPEQRNTPLEELIRDASVEQMLEACAAVDQFRRTARSLYDRVRALFMLQAIHRFHLNSALSSRGAACLPGIIPVDAIEHLLNRRFNEAVDRLLDHVATEGYSDAIGSALAEAYGRLGFATLARQVRHSVRSVTGNRWMFRMGHPADHPLRIRSELRQAVVAGSGRYPILQEETPVRMDLTHSGWSDIFFLGMDYPEGARVINVSIDLAVEGRDDHDPVPPISTWVRAIDEPVLRLVSLDLEAKAEITTLAEVFDFARDYLGLLKAAVIAAGIVPPALEGSDHSLAALLRRLLTAGGEFSLTGDMSAHAGPRGLEIVSRVNGIPKGSRLAVSTNLLASLIALLMRATGQTQNLTGTLSESERRTVAARAILGEWLGGSGGGWQDSGGIWPGIKRIRAVTPEQGDPEFGISRGRLLPVHDLLGRNEVGEETRRRLQESLVLVHGGMAQDVGPVLEMVTERYLLRSQPAWDARQTAVQLFDEIDAALQAGDVAQLAALTTRNFFDPICTIIPWASNTYTEQLIQACRDEFGAGFRGFLMLGGMSGGGMGFLFAPDDQARGRAFLAARMQCARQSLRHAVPFAMDPVVYRFAVNETGTRASVHATEASARMPDGYYALLIPEWLRQEGRSLTRLASDELEFFASRYHRDAARKDSLAPASEGDRDTPAINDTASLTAAVLDRLLPRTETTERSQRDLEVLLDRHGFDRGQHEKIRAELRAGRIGLAQNRMHLRTQVENVAVHEIEDARSPLEAGLHGRGEEALASGEVAVVTLAGGIGTRWTHGAGVVKAINPFCRLSNGWRSFLDLHLAKSRRSGCVYGVSIPHIITTSYLTHEPIREWADRAQARQVSVSAGPEAPDPELLVSEGRSVGLRFIPMVRDLQYAWEETPQQLLDERQERVRGSARRALINWARSMGEGTDYTDNLPRQCLHPIGHWYEIPNLMRNGVLAELLARRPNLRHLMVHNVDTTGVHLRPDLFGLHLDQGRAFTVEVMTRHIDDRGGGLARIDGRLRLVEGLALPREDLEFNLSFYNTATMWIDIDRMLGLFGLSRDQLHDQSAVEAAIRRTADRMPTYVALKDVKKRWGHGQEDVFPVAQCEKLWTDMTALPNVDCTWVVVPRVRGQQLKEPAQLDRWHRDGSAEYVDSLCAFAV